MRPLPSNNKMVMLHNIRNQSAPLLSLKARHPTHHSLTESQTSHSPSPENETLLTTLWWEADIPLTIPWEWDTLLITLWWEADISLTIPWERDTLLSTLWWEADLSLTIHWLRARRQTHGPSKVHYSPVWLWGGWGRGSWGFHRCHPVFLPPEHPATFSPHPLNFPLWPSSQLHCPLAVSRPLKLLQTATGILHDMLNVTLSLLCLSRKVLVLLLVVYIIWERQRNVKTERDSESER